MGNTENFTAPIAVVPSLTSKIKGNIGILTVAPIVKTLADTRINVR